MLGPVLHTFAVNCADRPTFFGLYPWYQYLQLQDDGLGHCMVQNFHTLGSNSSFLLIALAVIDDLVRVAALIAVFFVIYGGITYITSQGSPDQTGKAQSTIINALIGLAIALIAAAFVNYLGNTLGG
jgi:uncharacterized membrane protein